LFTPVKFEMLVIAKQTAQNNRHEHPHKNARTTPHIRALIVDRAICQQQSIRDIDHTFGISRRTVYQWLARYREADAETVG